MNRRIILTVLETDDEKQMSAAVKAVRSVLHLARHENGLHVTDQIYFPEGSAFSTRSDFEDALAISERSMHRISPRCHTSGPDINKYRAICERRYGHDGLHRDHVPNEVVVEW